MESMTIEMPIDVAKSYALKKPIDLGFGCYVPVGTKIRVLDWDDKNVRISFCNKTAKMEHSHFWWVIDE